MLPSPPCTHTDICAKRVESCHAHANAHQKLEADGRGDNTKNDLN